MTYQLFDYKLDASPILIVNKLADLTAAIILIHFVLELQPVLILL
jgi:hypothetical protein